jgi:hypothetical protein
MGFGSEDHPGHKLDGGRDGDVWRCGAQVASWPFHNERFEGSTDTEHDVVPTGSAETCRDRSSDGSHPDDSDDTHGYLSLSNTVFFLGPPRHNGGDLDIMTSGKVG